jgi:Domain of unknown function (DUF1931)
MEGIPELERFLRSVAGVDADTADVYRLYTFVDEKVEAMAFAGRNAARANGRDVIAPHDLPITACLRDQMHDFSSREEADELRQVLGGTPRRPPGDVTFGEGTQAHLDEAFGGIALALARAFRILDPELQHPTVEHWTRVFELYRPVL